MAENFERSESLIVFALNLIIIMHKIGSKSFKRRINDKGERGRSQFISRASINYWTPTLVKLLEWLYACIAFHFTFPFIIANHIVVCAIVCWSTLQNVAIQFCVQQHTEHNHAYFPRVTRCRQINRLKCLKQSIFFPLRIFSDARFVPAWSNNLAFISVNSDYFMAYSISRANSLLLFSLRNSLQVATSFTIANWLNNSFIWGFPLKFDTFRNDATEK